MSAVRSIPRVVKREFSAQVVDSFQFKLNVSAPPTACHGWISGAHIESSATILAAVSVVVVCSGGSAAAVTLFVVSCRMYSIKFKPSVTQDQ